MSSYDLKEWLHAIVILAGIIALLVILVPIIEFIGVYVLIPIFIICGIVGLFIKEKNNEI